MRKSAGCLYSAGFTAGTHRHYRGTTTLYRDAGLRVGSNLPLILRRSHKTRGFYSFRAQIELSPAPPPSRAPSCSYPGPHALKISALPSPVIRLTEYT